MRVKALKPEWGHNIPSNEEPGKAEMQMRKEVEPVVESRYCADKESLGRISSPELDDEEEPALDKLTAVDMQKMDRLSPLEWDDEEEPALDKLTAADMRKMDRFSPLEWDDEEEPALDKLTAADMREMDRFSPLEWDDNEEEPALDKLTAADMQKMNQKDIGGNISKVTSNETKPQESDNRGQSQLSDLHSPNLLFAREIIRKYRLKRMSKDETGLWRSNGRSYEPLTREDIEAIVYAEIPYEVKIELNSCAAIKRNVTEYIYDEIALMVKEGRREYYFDNSDYELIMGRVVLQNGVYNIKEDLLEDFDPNSPYYYELNAIYLECDDELLETPTFDKVISDACEGDNDTIKTMQQGLGVLLIPDKVKKIIVLGPASNSGKSVICGRLLETILPKNRIQHISPAALKGKFALGNAENAVLISCMDVDMENISPAAAGVIKRATGEDVISTEKKHQNARDIYVRFKFVFGTNGGFCTSQYDAGWLNRLFVIPFTHELSDEEIDMRVPEKLVAEKDAIVTKLLRAVREALMPDGSIKLYESPTSRALKLKWCMQNNYFEDFFGQMVDLTGNDLDNYSSEEVYDAYSRFYIWRVKQNKEHRNCCKLTKTEVISNLIRYGGGLIVKKRMSQNRNERFKNAQHRICGFLLKSLDIFDNNDRYEIGN